MSDDLAYLAYLDRINDPGPAGNGQYELAAHPAANPVPPLRVVTLHEFIETTEDVAEPLIGTPDETLLPAEGLLLMYGDGGAGKTTLSVDALAHLAAGRTWLGIPVPQPLRVLLIENEGPRGPFRRRLAAKVNDWQDDPFHDRVSVLEEPWTRFTLQDAGYRAQLGQEIDRTETDVVIVGPLASLGAKGTGTPDEINEFSALVDDLRDQAARPFALWIVHHENKAGDVSGAWERYPDTLVHVSAQGNGRTRVHWRKVRWSSELHNTSSLLAWAPGSGFELEEKRERDYKAEILEHFQKDNHWRTLSELSASISANKDYLRDPLSEMVNEGVFTFQIGPPGRSPKAQCWKLRTGSDAPSQSEPVALFRGAPDGLAPLAPPVGDSGEPVQSTPVPPTRTRTPEPVESDPNDDIPF